MSDTKLIKVGEKTFKCRYSSGYNNHNYTIVHDNADGRYVGELEDSHWDSASFMGKLKELVKNNG